MNTYLRRVIQPISAFIVLLLAAVSGASTLPFVGSPKVAHATLYLNVSQRAREIWPVEITAVDGKLSSWSKHGVLWIRPGVYTFTLRVGMALNLADVPGLMHANAGRRVEHTLHLQVEAGKSYYLGAKFERTGTWEPVVWKVRAMARRETDSKQKR